MVDKSMEASVSWLERERDLECPICQDSFTKPKMLPCGHTYCLEPCLLQIAADKRSIMCPECRCVHVLPSGGVHGFPTNISIGRMIRGTKRKAEEECVSTCPVCAGTEMLLKCFHCSVCLCEDCRTDHTNLMYQETSLALSNLRSLVSSSHFTDLHIKVTQLDKVTQNSNESIDAAIEAICGALREYGAQSKAKVSKRGQDCQQNYIEVSSKLTKVQEFCERPLKKVVSQNKLLKLQQDIKEHEQSLQSWLCQAESVQLFTAEVNIKEMLEGLHGALSKVQAQIRGKQAEISIADPVLQAAVVSMEGLEAFQSSHSMVAQKPCTQRSASAISQRSAVDLWAMADIAQRSSSAISHRSASAVASSSASVLSACRSHSMVAPKPVTQRSSSAVLQRSVSAVASSSASVVSACRSLLVRNVGVVKRCVGGPGDGPAMFDTPTSVAVSPTTNHVIVADNGNNRVQVFSDVGELISVITTVYRPPDDTKLRSSTHEWRTFAGKMNKVIVDSHGDIYVLDGRILRIFTEEGRYINHWPVQMIDAASFAVDNEQRIHVCCSNSGVNVFNRAGEKLFEYGQNNPDLIDKNKHVTDISINPYNGDIDIFTEKFNTLFNGYSNMRHLFSNDFKYIRSTSFGSYLPANVSCITRIQDMFVMCNGSPLAVYDRDLRFLKNICTVGRREGELYHPTGVALTLQGDIVVVDGNNYLQWF